MKKADFIMNIALMPIDFVVLFLASISAYYLRFSDSITQLRPVLYEMPSHDYLILTLQMAIFGIFIFALSGFYTMTSKKLTTELPKIFTGVSMIVIFLVLAIFLQRELFSSRFIIIFGWALAIVYLSIIRLIIFSIRDYFFKKGYGLAKVIALGEANNRQIIIDAYKKNPRLGYQVVGEIDDVKELMKSSVARDLIKEKQIDSIIQTDSSMSKDETLDLLTFCQENHIALKYVASLFQTQNINLNLSSVGGWPIVEIKASPLDGWRRVIKRIFDLIVALFLLIILSPLFLILAIVIKSTSLGPIFVSLDRVGSKDQKFKLYKFRSMIKEAHKLKKEMMVYNERSDGPLFKIKDDPRVTKFGRWLRRTSLDELPQLFNVVKGEMSLVGPRPHEPEEVSRYQRGYKKLLAIKPGMTGMAQVSGRSSLPFSEEAKLDIFYVENWSILLDLIILIKTTKVFLKNDEAC